MDLLVRPSLSKMTMASGVVVAVGPEMAGEANPGKESPSTGGAVVGRGCVVGAGGSGFPCCTFLLRLEGPACFRHGSTLGDCVAPDGPVGGERLP